MDGLALLFEFHQVIKFWFDFRPWYRLRFSFGSCALFGCEFHPWYIVATSD